MTRDLLAAIVAALVFVAGFSVAAIAAVEDARTGRLRNRLTLALAVIAVVGLSAAALIGGDEARLPSMVIGAVMFCLPWFVVHLVSPRGVGFGDIKLTAGLGLYLGWIDPVLSPVATVVAAVLFAAVALAHGAARDETRPFGPALVAGAVLATLGSFAL